MARQARSIPLTPPRARSTPSSRSSTLTLAATGFVDPSSGVGGILDFDGQVKSDGHKLHSEGKAKAAELRVVKGGQPAKQPVALDYKSDYALDSDTRHHQCEPAHRQ